MKIWTVAYVNDDIADEFGAEVFTDQAKAYARCDELCEQDDTFAVVERHEVRGEK